VLFRKDSGKIQNDPPKTSIVSGAQIDLKTHTEALNGISASRRDVVASRPRLHRGSKPTNGRFGDLVVSKSLASALVEMGYTAPTAIQTAVIPRVREGLDVVGQAQTGTGKTAAFGIPLVEALSSDLKPIQALVLVPTRELAVQVRAELGRLGKYKGLKSVAIYGGQAINLQLDALQHGAQIIVATPGRLIDHIERRTVGMNHIKFVVLDEADQMLDIGFSEDINRILRHCPSFRQTLLFSATMPAPIKRLAQRYMKNPVWVLIGREAEPVEEVTQIYFEVAERDKYAAIEDLLLDPDKITQALVFRRTKIGVDRLVTYLKRRGHDVYAIHGDITQAQRDAVMGRFRGKKLRVLVATNLAARGLDIPAVSHVINYDIPDTVEEYIHRIGRTARMGRSGTAITFVSEWDFSALAEIQARVGDHLKGARSPIYNR
jgi:ATP-dependent RNA helicase DeaD